MYPRAAGTKALMEAGATSDEYAAMISEWRLEQPIRSGRGKKRKQPQVEEDEDFEKAPRKFHESSDLSADLLPIMTDKGWRKQKGSQNEKAQPEESPMEEPEPEPEPEPEAPLPVLTAVEQLSRIEELKKEIGRISVSIVENPVENLALVSKFKSIREELRGPTLAEEDFRVTKLCLLSQMAVFKEILPSYAIREHSQKESEAKLSKEVKKLHDWESRVVGFYSSFLRTLKAEFTNSVGSQKHVQSYRLTVLKCLLELLVGCRDFNFHREILVFVTTHLCKDFPPFKEKKSEAKAMTEEFFRKLFSTDQLGSSSLYIVEQVSNAMQKLNYVNCKAISPSFIRAFDCIYILKKNSLPLAESGAFKAAGAPHLSRQKAKLLKAQVGRMKADQMIENEVFRANRERNLKELIRYMFRVFFGILKSAKVSTDAQILQSGLSGICKFCNLIGEELYPDLVRSLKALVSEQQVPECSFGFSLLTTLFRIVNAKSQSVSFDLKEFYVYFYALISQLSCVPKIPPIEDEFSKDLLSCIDNLFCRAGSKSGSNAVSLDRAAAFALRFISILRERCSSLGEKHASPLILEVLGRLFRNYQQIEFLFDSEENCGKGVYKKDAKDPDYANATHAKLEDIFPPQERQGSVWKAVHSAYQKNKLK